MGRNLCKEIEAWFADYSQDGDFVYEGRSAPYTVIGPSKSRGHVIFATKPSIVALSIWEDTDFALMGLIGRYGLPYRFDVAWIRSVVANHEVLFLGDMDPVDLMIFSWLRTRLRPKRIEHLGISDAYLADLQINLPDSFIMPCSRSERRSMRLLKKVFPDLTKIVGAKCAGILEQGRKIELDAVVSALPCATAILRPVINSKK